ncbi:MAG TPA: HAD family phosphatase [Clostridiales bacterium]|jgi:putative hydrolase of the HAD superfamily|nr:HAD family phosphatase [Clostridiales bacterium]
MINTVILDIGNVLAGFDYITYLKEKGISGSLMERLCKATVENTLWREIDRSDSDTIDESLITEFMSQDPEIAVEIRHFLQNSYEIAKEYDYASDFVRSLKRGGYPVYLLSNYGKANFKYARDNFDFFKYVDGGVISYETGYVKPEAGIYEAIINKYNIKPEEAVFLDDVKANIIAASDFGFHTIHFKNLSQAIKELHQLGVKTDI